MDTPVALIIFNRSDLTERVLNEIAKVKPSQLVVIADGPRDGILNDLKKCKAARDVIERVDWNCQLYKIYSDINLVCVRRPASGINWGL